MKTLFLIDANSLIHRCFHALPPLTGPAGQPTGALYGLAGVLIKILKEQKPDYVAAFFDRPEPTFRKEMFEDYKIHRPKAPDELVSQIIEARSLFKAFKIKTFEVPGFEADDLIGGAGQRFKNIPDLKLVIFTGDLDMLQLIENGKIIVETFKKGISDTIVYDEKNAAERYGGLRPSQLPDFKGLVGDPSDNIPGVPGIGPKTAAPIILEYGNLENFLQNGQLNKNYPKIAKFRGQALLSKKLATIRKDAPGITQNIDELKCEQLKKNELVSYLNKLGFKTLIERINNQF